MNDLIPLLITSSAQAFLSSALSLICGIIGAFGLVRMSRSIRRPAELFLLLPQILPSLFILMSTYNLYSYFGDVPSGFFAVVLVHAAINCGFCTVVLARLYSEKAGSYSELARIEGAGLKTFFPALIQLLYRDLLFVFFTVFIFCFTSFSVPFVIGGYGSSTIEVEIYERIISQGAIGEALILCALQMAFLMVMGLFLYGKGYSLNQKANRTFIYGHWLAALPLLLLNALILFGSVGGLMSGWQSLQEQEVLRVVAMNATVGTLFTSVIAGVASLLIISLIAFIWPTRQSTGWLFGFTGPSPILFGFFLFLFQVHQIYGPSGFLFLGILLALFFTPLIFRFGMASEFSKYNRQVEVAKTLGASRSLIFARVLWPQLARSIFVFAGIVAFWAAGDFALSLFILPGEAHLPLLIRGLISRYRLDAATLLMWWMVVIGMVQLLIFQGIGYVVSRKST